MKKRLKSLKAKFERGNISLTDDPRAAMKNAKEQIQAFDESESLPTRGHAAHHLKEQADSPKNANQITVDVLHETADPALLKLTFVQHVLDKRFHLEMWLDNRVSSNITLNAILATLAMFTAGHLGASKNIGQPILFVGLLAFTLNLAICSYLHVPRFRSRRQMHHLGEYEPRNLRTTEDIERLSVAEYKRQILKLTTDEMILLTADQIKQVNSIIQQERRFLTFSSILTMIGILALSSAVILVTLDLNWVPALAKAILHATGSR